MNRELPPQIAEILKQSHFAYLCTTDKNNQPHITPMFFVFDEETCDILVLTHPKSKKLRNLQMNPKVCLTVDVRDPKNPFENRGVMVQGKAVMEQNVDVFSVSGDKTLRRIYKEFSQKYPVLSDHQDLTRLEYQEFRGELVRVIARKMVYWRGPRFITVNLPEQTLRTAIP